MDLNILDQFQRFRSNSRGDAYGVQFLPNSDLPERQHRDANLNEPDRVTSYGGGPEGYTSYPFLAGAC
jgi:hypothetical protein